MGKRCCVLSKGAQDYPHKPNGFVQAQRCLLALQGCQAADGHFQFAGLCQRGLSWVSEVVTGEWDP